MLTQWCSELIPEETDDGMVLVFTFISWSRVSIKQCAWLREQPTPRASKKCWFRFLTRRQGLCKPYGTPWKYDLQCTTSKECGKLTC
eukprot:4678332-Amphidinium_carterae.1